MLPGAYRRALDTVSRSLLGGVLALLRGGARLPEGDDREAARDRIADRITLLVWEHRDRARDAAHAYLIDQARQAGISGDVYTPNPPAYHRASMRQVLADFDEQGGFARPADQIAQHVGATAIRHTESAARQIMVDAVEGNAPDDVETAEEAEARWDERDARERRLWAENYGRKPTGAPSKRARPARWARMLTGAENCAFCVMLAARGPVYEGKSAAIDGDWIGKFGDAFHNNCDCIAVPVFSKQWDGGETASKLQRFYERAQEAVSDDDLQQRRVILESPDQLRKLRKYLLEHADELEQAVPNIRDQADEPMSSTL